MVWNRGISCLLFFALPAVAEWQSSQVWASGTSTVGTGAEAKPGARNVPITIDGVDVSPVGFLLF